VGAFLAGRAARRHFLEQHADDLVFCAVFIGVYLWLYQSIVRFHTPLWLVLR
jgi:hypothetical protein